MAKLLNVRDVDAAVYDVVTRATKRVTFISPCLKLTSQLYRRLKDADAAGIKTIFVCRKDNIEPAMKGSLKRLKNLELRFRDTLHAKCIYNEQTMVITSWDLYGNFHSRRGEFGVLLSLYDDRDRAGFYDAVRKTQFIVSTARPDRSPGETIKSMLRAAVSALGAVIGAVGRSGLLPPRVPFH